MNPEWVIQTAIQPALRLLPARMISDEAVAMMLATGLQEGQFQHRRQMGGGPARGLWQFERGGGVHGVLSHPATSIHIRMVLDSLEYPLEDLSTEEVEFLCYTAIEHNDILAAAFARLNLWWLPMPLPARNNPAGAWSQYIRAWKPGKPHPEFWDDNFETAWDML